MSILPSMSSITSCLPTIASPRQMLRNASGLAITAIALSALSNLSLASAGHCEEIEATCVKLCMGGQSFEVAACLLGCRLGYWACIANGG